MGVPVNLSLHLIYVGNPNSSIDSGRPYDPATTAGRLKKPTFSGSSDSSTSTTCGIRRRSAEPEINAFLTHLAVKNDVSASTQNQALSALLFLYRFVIGREVGSLDGVIRARKPKRLPVVMTREEVRAVLDRLTGDKRLMASLMYGAGLRLMECLRLRVRTSISAETRYNPRRQGRKGQDHHAARVAEAKPSETT